MSLPTLSVIVPTIGRATLARTLASVRVQAPASDVEIVVVGDGHGDRSALDGVPAVCARHEAIYYEHDGGVHAWGHPQRNYGAQVARGEWLAWLQDDDVYAEGGILGILEQIALGIATPILFRTQTWQAGVVWRTLGVLAEGQIDADCLVAPNDPDRLGAWTPRYNGDWDAIRATVDAYGGPEAVAWVDQVIALGRPS